MLFHIALLSSLEQTVIYNVHNFKKVQYLIKTKGRKNSAVNTCILTFSSPSPCLSPTTALDLGFDVYYSRAFLSVVLYIDTLQSHYINVYIYPYIFLALYFMYFYLCMNGIVLQVLLYNFLRIMLVGLIV